MQTQQKQPSKESKKLKYLYGPAAVEFGETNTGSWRIERPVIDFTSCSKCGICAMFCPADIVTIDKEKEACVEMDMRYCKGCGICANECPKHCITMVDERGEA